MKAFRIALALALVLSLADLPPAAAQETGPAGAARTFAVIPYYGPEKMWQLFSPFVEYIRRETGEPWDLKLYPTHAEMTEAICAGEVDVVLLGPVPLGRVNRACGAAPFLVPLAADGTALYYSMLLTGDPGVTSVAGLRGKRIGVLKGSTAAHVLPVKMLADAGLGAGSYTPVYLENQDRIMAGLLDGSIAGAGVKEALYRRFQKEKLRLLMTSDPLPNFAFCALPTQPPTFRERFVAALLKLRPRENEADALTVKTWDDEIKNGFATPPPDFLASVQRLYELSESVRHANE